MDTPSGAENMFRGVMGKCGFRGSGALNGKRMHEILEEIVQYEVACCGNVIYEDWGVGD